MNETAGAIIVAGGKGLRFGGPVRKQYLRLRGKPLLWWSIAAFESSPQIGSIVVVVPQDDQAAVLRMIRRARFRKVARVVAGGAERRDSVYCGLQVLDPSIRWVAVHDAVRPLVSQKTLEATLKEARRYKAALPACPSKDTIKIINPRGFVAQSPDRRTVFLAQTPQCFERALLERAHRLGRRWPVTDDAQMVERLGVRVKIVEASAENLKITTPMDLTLARMIIQGRSS